ncbi:disease resistance protein [Striga asiatica]|uniref:Disease resistance protein n=1 Tax=Striga asiatica TaxID=4170 RepID=A0A5A7QS84_STRAF|nr:disease resistance protein [Striga asiatica]
MSYFNGEKIRRVPFLVSCSQPQVGFRGDFSNPCAVRSRSSENFSFMLQVKKFVALCVHFNGQANFSATHIRRECLKQLLGMEIAAAVATIMQCLCAQCSTVPNSEKLNYLRKPKAALQILTEKSELLAAREADMKTKLDEENIFRGMDPSAEVKLWLNNVHKLNLVLSSFNGEMQAKKTCLCGCIPNYFSRLKLGSYVSKKIHEIDKLLEQSQIFQESSLVKLPSEKGKPLPTSSLVGETVKVVLQRAWEFLTDINTETIGIYGMGGVGKTSIVKEINNKLLKDDETHFEFVIWVTASKDSNVEKLQKDIAREVGLCFDEEDNEMRRARKLSEALRRRRKFLLIIDDLWEAFSLENVGIPICSSLRVGKLLITTRSLRVCRRMEVEREIEVGVLTQQDSWDLFQQKVGQGIVLNSPKIHELAKKVAKECGGLPLALVTIGRAMRNETKIKYWQTALTELRNSTASSIEGMASQVFSQLRFSYDRLKDDVARSCFLYCALYPEDHLIETDELIEYWVWEGLLGGVPGGHPDKMKRGEIVLNELVSSCMLESSSFSFSRHVRMHDLIRDMAIALTRENSSFMVKSGCGLRAPPEEGEWGPDLERVSLMRNDISSLCCEPDCPKLRTLLLQYNSIEKGVLPTFFSRLRNIEVLDLSYTGMDNLPDSISLLEKLRALLLRSCWNLSALPSFSKLEKLRVLDLTYTPVECLPEGMNVLNEIRRLSLSYTKISNSHTLPFANYRFLESLSLLCLPGPVNGQSLAEALVRCSNNSLVELEVSFGCMEEFIRYVKSGYWGWLDNFKFLIGFSASSSVNIGKNSIAFSGVDLNESLRTIWLPDKILELEIHTCSDITHLPVFITSAASKLQRCRIQYCEGMEFVLVEEESSTLPNLELLEIEGLSKLSGICRGILPEGTLARLRVLHVRACNGLKALFPLELGLQLKNLVEIQLENCEKVSEIIAAGEEEQEGDVRIVFPGLQILKLSFLPELKHMSRGVMVCDSLSSLEVYRCPELTILPFFVDVRNEVVDSLKQIRGSKKWWKCITANHENAASRLEPAFEEINDGDDSDDDSSVCSDGSELIPR